MLSDKLRTNTSDYHQQTEVMLVTRIKGIDSKSDYAALLGLFYSYFGGLEKLIDNAIDKSQMTDYDHRRKTASLKSDLEYLNAPIPDFAPADALPKIRTHARALGALYVIEGSTLGGKIISKMVTQKLSLPHSAGLSFFNGYGADTDTMWAGFKEQLNGVADTDAETEVINAANDTFLCFKEWIKQYYLAPELNVKA